MISIDEYSSTLSDVRRERMILCFDYLRRKYPDLEESCDYTPKIKIPYFKRDNGTKYGIYVAFSSPKAHMSIHFSNYQGSIIVKGELKNIKTGVGCVNIPDKVDFPMGSIQKAFDITFSWKLLIYISYHVL